MQMVQMAVREAEKAKAGGDVLRMYDESNGKRMKENHRYKRRSSIIYQKQRKVQRLFIFLAVKPGTFINHYWEIASQSMGEENGDGSLLLNWVIPCDQTVLSPALPGYFSRT